MNNYIYEFKDLPSTDIPYNAKTFTAMQNKLLDSIFPIGRGFIDFTNTDYSNYLGFTWERELVGLTPIGYNPDDEDFNTIGATMGEKAHTLTIDEMPSHKHQVLMSYSPNSGHTHSNGTYSASFSEGANPSDGTYSTTDNRISNTGGDQPHNIIQPSKVVAYWKRVA